MPPKESSRKWKKWLELFLLALALAGLALFLRCDFWRISRVDCRDNGAACSADLWVELTSESLGKNILFLSVNKFSQKISRNHPEYFQIKIKKRLPNKLLFEMVVRRAVVALKQSNGDYYLADEEGVVLEKTDKIVGYPQIFLDQEVGLVIKEKIQDEPILKLIEIINQCRLRLLEPKEAKKISSRAAEINFQEGFQVLFSIEKNFSEQLDTLQFILDRTKIEGKKLKSIDLRFEKPIVEDK